jgi:anti-anti-sigma factor
VHIQEKDGFTWIRLPDSINMDNYVKIEQEIAKAIKGPSPKVVIDLSVTGNLYSSGLGLLIRLRKRVNEENGVLFLVNVSRKLSAMFEAVHLERLFTMFATDVEFEISQEDVFERETKREKVDFVFVSRVENGVFRINMSGALATGQDFAAINAFAPDPSIKRYVFDLTGLDTVDSSGSHALCQLFLAIHNQGGRIVTYGSDVFVNELLEILSLTELVTCCKNEREAMDAAGKK